MSWKSIIAVSQKDTISDNVRLNFGEDGVYDFSLLYAPISLGSGYIQNQNAAAQSANLWIDGTGLFNNGIVAGDGNSGNYTVVNGSGVSYNYSSGSALLEEGVLAISKDGGHSFITVGSTSTNMGSDQILQLVGTSVRVPIIPIAATDVLRLTDYNTLGDARYLSLSGGTITGDTTFNNNNLILNTGFIGIGENISNIITTPPQTPLPILTVSRNVNWSTINYDNIRDLTVINPIDAGSKFCSFDVSTSANGSFDYSHLAAFQDRVNYNGTGTLNLQFGFYSNPTFNSGTTNIRRGVWILNPTGAGTLVSNYGIYIDSQSKGSTDNFAFYNETTKMYSGGKLGLGNQTSPLTVLDAGVASGNGTQLDVLRITNTSATATGRLGLGFFNTNINANQAQISTSAGTGYLQSKLYFSVDDGTGIHLADRMIIDNYGTISTTSALIKNSTANKIIKTPVEYYTSGTTTGALIIKHATLATATRFDFRISLYNYNLGQIADWRITFYKSTATTIVAAVNSYISQNIGIPSTQVRVGFDASGNLSIILGDIATAWSTATGIIVREITTSTTGFGDASWDNGWSIAPVTDLTGYTSLQSATPTIFAPTTSPALVTPNLGTPSAGVMTNVTGLPLTTGITGILLGANGGTGIANTGKTITLGGNLITSGAFATTLTSTAATSVTLPTTGILATLAGTETLTNKTIDGVTPATMAFVDPTSSIQTQLNSKAASATTLAGYSITDAYTKTVSDGRYGILAGNNSWSGAKNDFVNSAVSINSNVGTGITLSGYTSTSGRLVIANNFSNGGGETDLFAGIGSSGTVGGFNFYGFVNAGTSTLLASINGQTMDFTAFGKLVSGATGGSTGTLLLYGGTSGQVNLSAQATTATYSLLLPSSAPSANKILAQNGSNTALTWVDINSNRLASFYTDAANSSTSATDIYSYTVSANTLTNDGGFIDCEYSIKLATQASSVNVITISFGGQTIFSTGTFNNPSMSFLRLSFQLYRTGATTARCVATFNTGAGGVGNITPPAVDITGVDFTTTNILKAVATGGATNDITFNTGFYRLNN